METTKKETITVKEIQRKILFLLSAIIPISYALWLTKWEMLSYVALATAIIYFIDYNRHYSKFWQKISLLFVGKLLKKDEKPMKGRLMHCTVYLISTTFTILLFPKHIAINAMLILIFADTMAALVGKKYGHTSIFHNKTLEGFYAFLVTGAVVTIFTGICLNENFNFYVGGLFGVFFAGVTELMADKFGIEDDYAIPAVMGGVMLLMRLV